jgi:hypothetical protein
VTVCLLTIQSKAAKNKGFVAGPMVLLVLVTRVEISLGNLAHAHIHQKNRDFEILPELQEDGISVRGQGKGATR